MSVDLRVVFGVRMGYPLCVTKEQCESRLAQCRVNIQTYKTLLLTAATDALVLFWSARLEHQREIEAAIVKVLG